MSFRMLGWMPPSVASFIYSTVFKPPFVRPAVHWVVKKFIPRQMQIDGLTFALNRDDAIVSGALALGFYESYPRRAFAKLLRPEMCVVDIGANIGLYTAIAAKAVGSGGQVLAIEPENNNCRFIAETVKLNNLNNVRVLQMAVSDETGQGHLFLCDSNKADHRIFNESGDRPSVGVELVRLDDLLGRLGVGRVDVMKMDVQGAEAMAFAGMRKTLESNPHVRMMMEFWPWGIKRAKGDPAKLLADIRQAGFEIFELTDNACVRLDSSQDAALAAMPLFRQHANLLLQRDRTTPVL